MQIAYLAVRGASGCCSEYLNYVDISDTLLARCVYRSRTGLTYHKKVRKGKTAKEHGRTSYTAAVDRARVNVAEHVLTRFLVSR